MIFYAGITEPRKNMGVTSRWPFLQIGVPFVGVLQEEPNYFGSILRPSFAGRLQSTIQTCAEDVGPKCRPLNIQCLHTSATTPLRRTPHRLIGLHARGSANSGTQFRSAPRGPGVWFLFLGGEGGWGVWGVGGGVVLDFCICSSVPPLWAHLRRITPKGKGGNRGRYKGPCV